MYWLEHVGFILGLAWLGYWVFAKLHFPAPTVIGPMIFVGSFQIFGSRVPQLPVSFMDLFQIIMGLSIGAGITAKKLADLRKIWLPGLVVFFWTLVSTALMTLVIGYYTTDMITAFFSAAPGGVSVMATLALSYHSEVAIVSTYQFVRLLVILGVIPLIAKFAGRSPSKHKREITEIQTELENKIELQNELQTEIHTHKKTEWKDHSIRINHSLKNVFIYGIGMGGGVILTILHFPSGGIIGSMAALATMNVMFREEQSFPSFITKFANLGIGASVGLEFSPLMTQKIHEMFFPIIGFSIIIVLSNFALGGALRLITRWDTITCLLGASPGGLSQMVVVGEEMNADTLVISVLQLVRMLTIVICVPLVAALLVT